MNIAWPIPLFRLPSPTIAGRGILSLGRGQYWWQCCHLYPNPAAFPSLPLPPPFMASWTCASKPAGVDPNRPMQVGVVPPGKGTRPLGPETLSQGHLSVVQLHWHGGIRKDWAAHFSGLLWPMRGVQSIAKCKIQPCHGIR